MNGMRRFLYFLLPVIFWLLLPRGYLLILAWVGNLSVFSFALINESTSKKEFGLVTLWICISLVLVMFFYNNV